MHKIELFIMENFKELLIDSDIRGIMDYLRIARKIDQKFEFDKVSTNKKIKIAVLSNFNLGGIREVLLVKCLQQDIYADIYVGGYNQYNQEILDIKSAFYSFEPDLLILVIDIRSIANETYLQQYRINSDERREWISSTTEEVISLVEKVKQNSKAKILVHNFEVPTHSSLGIIENRQPYGFRESIEDLNSKLRAVFSNDPRTFLFDYESFTSKVGKDNIMDYKMYYLGDMRIDPQIIPKLCDEYIPYVRAMLSMVKKCLVLDLDDVLWGGIIGEEGLDGIKLGPTPEGRPFLELQKYILSLYQRGVILAVNSSNNLDDALEVFHKHPYMILKEDHFAAIKINWEDKVSNMKSIAEEIDVGIESLVFLDNSRVNRDIIKQALPEVLTVDLPDDSSLYLKTVMELRIFDTLQLTQEDRSRGKMYAEQRKRQEFGRVASDVTEYLKRLDMIVTIEKANQFNIPRISQLTQKTNQFNTTTHRYLEDDIRHMADSDNHIVVSLRVEDKFGDNGITGVAIVKKAKEKWYIETFLLSCRVLGRKVEDTLLAYITDQARQGGAKTLVAEFIPTKKNAPAKDFFKEHGFTRISGTDITETWEFNLQKTYPFPQYIKLVVR